MPHIEPCTPWPAWVPDYATEEDRAILESVYLGNDASTPSLSFSKDVLEIFRNNRAEIISWANNSSPDVLGYARYWYDHEDEAGQAYYIYVRAVQCWLYHHRPADI